MKRLSVPLAFAAACLLLLPCSCGERKGPLPVIIETDMGNDVDDALALALAHRAMDQGLLDLKMVSVHNLSATACRYVDMINTHLGHPGVPVSYADSPIRYKEDGLDFTAPVAESGSYALSGNCPDGIYPPSVAEYRRILAGSRNRSVVIVSLGFAPTLARLLDSPADAFSPLSGLELVRKKVKYLSIMAGSYGVQDTIPVAGVRETLFDRSKKRAEFNVKYDIPGMQKVFAEWPTPIWQNPFEIGKMVMYPGDVAFSVEGSPVFDGYRAYKEEQFDRPSWDILSVAFLLHPEMFGVSDPVTVSVDDDGFNHVVPGGPHRILVLTPDQASALREYEVAMTAPQTATNN